MPPRSQLPRISREWYRGRAAVLWTHVVRGRLTGWLDKETSCAFREVLLHTSLRYRLVVPAYVLMPDHAHVLWLGVTEDSDQLRAASFLRRYTQNLLFPQQWQRQAHDHVLREQERHKDALLATATYLLQNPVRAGLADRPADWPHAGALVPGYPFLPLHEEDFGSRFWRAVEGFRAWNEERP